MYTVYVEKKKSVPGSECFQFKFFLKPLHDRAENVLPE